MEQQDEYVPISAAAAAAAYDYTTVYKLAKHGRVRTRKYYKHNLVNLNDVLAYRARVQALGNTKHALRYPKPQETPDATPAE